jgi:hypothetical protein
VSDFEVGGILACGPRGYFINTIRPLSLCITVLSTCLTKPARLPSSRRMTVVSMCHISLARVVRRPISAWPGARGIGADASRVCAGGNTKSKARRRPCRAAAPGRRACQSGHAGPRPRSPSPCSPGSHSASDDEATCADRTIDRQARTRAAAVAMHESDSANNRRNRRTARNGTNSRARFTARRILILARPSGKRSCVRRNPEL